METLKFDIDVANTLLCLISHGVAQFISSRLLVKNTVVKISILVHFQDLFNSLFWFYMCLEAENCLNLPYNDWQLLKYGIKRIDIHGMQNFAFGFGSLMIITIIAIYIRIIIYDLCRCEIYGTGRAVFFTDASLMELITPNMVAAYSIVTIPTQLTFYLLLSANS